MTTTPISRNAARTPRGLRLNITLAGCTNAGKSSLINALVITSYSIHYTKLYDENFVLVVMEAGVHPIPFRTRKLSPPSPMILPGSWWESRPPPRLISKTKNPGTDEDRGS